MPPLTKTIPSYAYVQYNDDSDIQAFIAAYNQYAQQYLDTFNALQLPVYSGDLIAGPLLDWVALGVYGYLRPVLPSGITHYVGPLGTWQFNSTPFNQTMKIGPSALFATSDDVFKRCITWGFYKGDGLVFNIRWLKRRVQRFLDGINGTDPPVSTTYRVSVSFGAGNQVNILIVGGQRSYLGGAIFNGMGFNTAPFNSVLSSYSPYPPVAMAAILQSAIESGALELPFQFDWVVST